MGENVTPGPETGKLRFTLSLKEVEGRISAHIKQQLIETHAQTHTPISEYTADGFTLGKALRSRRGAFIEIAGPTVDGYHLVDFSKLDRRVEVSNISPGCPIYDEETGQLVTYWGTVDFQADSQQLPLRSNAVGALFASRLLKSTLPHTTQKAHRVLEPGGIWVLEHLPEEAIDTFKHYDFVTQYDAVLLTANGKYHHLVLQKPQD